jgi:hypothetical protein
MSPSRSGGAVSEGAKSTTPGIITPLSSGTLTVTTRQGTLTGTYTGEERGSTGALTLQLTGGTGEFAGAGGTLSGSGDGEFTGEGHFSLVLDGTFTTAAGSRKIRIGIRGTATIFCLDEVPILTLTGSGNVTGSGPSTVVATHQVANGDCTS